MTFDACATARTCYAAAKLRLPDLAAWFADQRRAGGDVSNETNIAQVGSCDVLPSSAL